MARISKTDVHAAFERVSKHMIDAAKNDGIASRADLKNKGNELEGTEKALFSMFWNYTDHRDHSPGARITKKDINKTLSHAKKKLVDRHDVNNNGMSKSEIAGMSRMGKLAVKLAQELKAATPVEETTSGAQLERLFDNLGTGLEFDGIWGSEGGVEITGVSAGPIDAMNEAEFKRVMGLGDGPNDEIIKSVDGKEVLEGLLADYNEYADIYGSSVDQCKKLVTAMGENLTDMRAYLVGQDSYDYPDAVHPLYIVGKAPDGTMAGVKSGVVWT